MFDVPRTKVRLAPRLSVVDAEPEQNGRLAIYNRLWLI